MGVNIIASVWGFAEATFFFIVPDVCTSAAGIKYLKAGLVACIWALCGALSGGLLMYLWGAFDLNSASEAVEWVPAVSHELVSRVREDLSAQGLIAVLTGPLSGTPYKIYAIQAHQAGISITAFLLISIPARLIRFLSVTMVIHIIARAALTRLTLKEVRVVFIGAWLFFYAVYFFIMPW
jgi:hypothetical protein